MNKAVTPSSKSVEVIALLATELVAKVVPFVLFCA
jgi:hypothetical protein